MAGATALALDSTGVYFAGAVEPSLFPKLNSIRNDNTILQPPAGGPVGAVKLTLDGQTVLYSTMFGGTLSDSPNAGAVDSQGHFYLGGITSDTDFPVVNAAQSTSGGGEDGFIAALSPTGNSLGHLEPTLAGRTKISFPPSRSIPLGTFTSSVIPSPPIFRS